MTIYRRGEYKKVIREAHRPINRILEFGMKRRDYRMVLHKAYCHTLKIPLMQL